ncbi:hypothetical protein J3A83DRAFT_61120 [Scleroderma citrinum]
MLLCRRILRPHVLNPSVLRSLENHSHHGRLAIVKLSLKDARFVSSNRSNDLIISTTSFQDQAMSQPNIPPPTPNSSSHPDPDPDPDLLATVLRVSRYSHPTKGVKEFKTVAGKTMVKESECSPFEAYMLLRAQIPHLAMSLPTEVLCCIAQGAVKHGCQDLVDSIAADILDNEIDAVGLTSVGADSFNTSTDINITTFRKTYSDKDYRNYARDTLQDRAQVAAALLCVSPRHSRLLAKRKVYALLRLVNSAGKIDSLPVVAACHAMKAIFDDPRPEPCDQHVINIALPRFLEWLGSWRAPTDARASTYKPSETILTAYGVVNRLLVLEEKENALALFRVLTENHHIPAEMFQQGELATKDDFGTIIRSVLVSACVHWGWHHLAVELMTTMFKTWNQEPQLERSTSERERFILRMLSLLHTAIESCTANHLRYCAILMCLLARSTARVVIPEPTIGLFYYRARLLRDGLSAEMFYDCTQSPKVLRTTRYPPPKGMTFVWLMNYLIKEKHNVHLARLLAKQLVEQPVPIPPNERGTLVAMVAKSGFAESARALWERYAVGNDPELVIGNAATMIRMVSLFANLVSRTRRKLEELERDTDADQCKGAIQATEAKLADLSEFSQGVVLAFQKLKQPLDKATHSDLNALARAYFLLGRMKQGLLPYRSLLRRKEIPDLYDINVALSAVSRHSPRMAADMVDRMIRCGLHPDAVTFGTVMHQALVHEDLELASTLVKQANDYGLEELSEKTMAALIRASVSNRVETAEALETNLRHVWEIVQAMPRTSVVRTPDIGKCCVRASVQIGNAEMAFGFWNMLVRWKVEWRDCEQAQMRRVIGELVRQHIQGGTLGKDRGGEMLHALGLGRSLG